MKTTVCAKIERNVKIAKDNGMPEAASNVSVISNHLPIVVISLVKKNVNCLCIVKKS